MTMGMFNAPHLEEIRKERESSFWNWNYFFGAIACGIIAVAVFQFIIKPVLDRKRAYELASEIGHQAFTARLLGDNNKIIGINEAKEFTLFVYYTGSVTYYASGRGGDTKNIQTQGGDGNYDIAKFRRQVAELEAKGMKLDEGSVCMERYPDGMFIIGKLKK